MRTGVLQMSLLMHIAQEGSSLLLHAELVVFILRAAEVHCAESSVCHAPAAETLLAPCRVQKHGASACSSELWKLSVEPAVAMPVEPC